MQKFNCYYDIVRFQYFKHLLDANGFKYCGNSNVIGKIAVFTSDKYNVYIDCHDGDCGVVSENVIRSAGGKPFLYFKTAYYPEDSEPTNETNRKLGCKVEPFFKWCGANIRDGFYNQLYPIRKELIAKNKNTRKIYDIGFCCNLLKPSVDLRRDYVKLFRDNFGDKFFHNEYMNYMGYINHSLQWKTSFNCRGCGEYTTRIMDACAIGKPSILSSRKFDNAISWKEYIPIVDFNSPNWKNELENIISNYEDWGQKCLYYYENYWTPDAIYNYMIGKINEFEASLC